MKKIGLKICLFIGLLIIINVIIRSFVPYWWGNPGYVEKYKYLKDNKENYNMIFLGSSRIYRHVIPNVLNKRLKKYDIKSFNMAYAATANPELFYLSENLLLEDWFDFEYVIIELSAITLISEKNFHSNRIKYNMNLESAFFAVKSLYIDNKLDYEQLYRHIISFIERAFNFGLTDDIIKFLMSDENIDNYRKLVINSGYKRFNENPKSSEYRKRHKTFLSKSVDQLAARDSIAHKIYLRYSNDKTIYNQVYLNRVNELIEIAEKKGIHIIFVVPPRAGSGKILLTSANNLNKKQKIVIYDSKKYPQFYNVNYSWDLGHLNRKGSEKFTMVLARKIEQILKKK